MKFDEKYSIKPGSEQVFSFQNKEEELEHEAKMIMFKFLSALEKLFSDKPLRRKDLAEVISTSPSFITQLYQGDKLINLTTLAKIQEAYGITFEITAKFNKENYIQEANSARKIGQ